MGKFALTTVLTPALSSRRGRIVRRLLEMSCDWIGRMVIRKIEIARGLFLLLGEKVRMRADMAGRVSPLRAVFQWWPFARPGAHGVTRPTFKQSEHVHRIHFSSKVEVVAASVGADVSATRATAFSSRASRDASSCCVAASCCFES